MANLHHKQQLQGLIGPLYVRNLNGKTIVQTRPIHPKQSKGTRASSVDFKYAMTQSQAIRQAFQPLLVLGTHPYTSQRLAGVLHKGFHVPQGVEEHYTLFTADLSHLMGFELHKTCPLEPLVPVAFPFALVADGSLHLAPVAVPPVNAKLLPEENTSCALVLMVASWHPDLGATAQTTVFSFALQRHAPTTIALQTEPYPAGTRLIVAAQLLVWNSHTVLGDKYYGNSKTFNPVQIRFTGVV
ncbi:hypothetical protein [Flavobacterium sp. XGLA_31]|uniref:hypothetical protein n=1 Tax=Flavobacterium sp. XGLA_31 TaxID=3447666 RepID=UPI003F3BFB98